MIARNRCASSAATGSFAAMRPSRDDAKRSDRAAIRTCRAISTTGYRRAAESRTITRTTTIRTGASSLSQSCRSSTTSPACAASSQRSRTLAVVGLSAQWYRPSYFAAKYMQDHGYRIIPVNPRYTEVLGENVLSDLQRDPGTCRPRRLLSQVRGDSRRSPTRRSRSARRCCGCSSASSTTKPRDTRRAPGLDVVMNRCVKIEHARILGGLNWAGVNTGRDLRAHEPAVCLSPRTPAVRRRGAASPMPDDSRRASRTADARPSLRLRHAVPARRADSRRADRRARAADLPDDVVRVRQRRPRGDACSTCRRSATSIRGSRIRRSRRSRSASPRSKAAAQRSPPPPAWPRRCSCSSRWRAHGDHIVAARSLYGGTYSQLAVTFAAVRHRHDVRRRRRSGKLSRRAAADDEGAVRRDDRQPAAQRARHRGDRRHRARAPACRSSSTTRSRRRTCAGRSSTAPTSSCIR